MNDTKKVTNAAMRTNKEVRNSFVANHHPGAQKGSQTGVKEEKQSFKKTKTKIETNQSLKQFTHAGFECGKITGDGGFSH